MKDKNRIEILLKLIERIYIENLEMWESVDDIIVTVCAEETVSHGQAFFILLFFAAFFITMVIPEKTLYKNVEDMIFLCEKTVYENSRSYIKRRGIF